MTEKETAEREWPPTPSQTPPAPDAAQQRERQKRAGAAFAVAGVTVGVIAFALVAHLLLGFYRDTLTLPRGTPIRPMGLTLAMGVVEVPAFLLGSPLALLGLILGVRGRSRPAVSLGVIGLCLCLALLPISSALILQIAASRGLFLEP